ncbi:hypothetical protein [Streptomyces werraensis]|uniref:hypothetical protein n=1 Tax=Streptomyces werraensis TaxID=68284 RepID=UPI00343737DA
MSNGWDWIREGQRIAEQSRQARGGELDLDAVRAESVVFESPMDALKRIVSEPTPQPASLVDEIRDLKNEVDVCRAGHCESGYEAVRLRDQNKRLRAALDEALKILGEV